MRVSETHINATKGYQLGDEDIYEPYTDNIGDLFRSFQKEYGRCISKCYIDPDAKQIGWVFQKKVQYTDCDEYYIHEVWIY